MGLFEFLYYLGYRLKTASDLKLQKRLPVKVVSVGNITSGGTGKTPATVALALEAVRRGLNPCVITRGYKGSLRGPVRITSEMTAGEAGDEPLLMARELANVPVIKCADRYRAGIFALEAVRPKPDLFLLDDGFQHRKLHRDKDILLVNARNPFDNGKLLPMGLLREPLTEMRRADVIMITKKPDENTKSLVDTIRRYNTSAPVFSSSYRLSSVVDASGQGRPADWLRGKDVFAFCGIGEPGAFRDSLLSSGARIRGFKAFRDHHRFVVSDLRKISNEAHVNGALWIITTEKDIMRFRGMELPENLLWLGIEFAAEGEFYDYILQ